MPRKFDVALKKVKVRTFWKVILRMENHQSSEPDAIVFSEGWRMEKNIEKSDRK